MTEEWVVLYKFGRLAVFALLLGGIALYVYNPKRKERLEEPARRMLEDDR